MKIKLNVLEIETIDEAIKAINDYSKTLKPKAKEIATRLSEIGKQVVDFSYSQSGEDYYLTCITKGNSSMIIAEGDNVLFIEFGTGVYTNGDTYEMETEGLPPIYAGSYSQLEGQGHFTPEHPYWYYGGVRYEGTIQLSGFYFASKEIKQQAVEVAKKVFKR